MEVKQIIESLIEEVICKPIEQLKKYPMDDETTELMMMLYISDMRNVKMNIPEKEIPFLTQVIQKRIEVCFQFKIESMQLLLFITQISQTPGKGIMYCWYLQYYCFKNNIDILTFEKFIHIFGDGFPSDSDLKNIYKNQKAYNAKEIVKRIYQLDDIELPFRDNMIDCMECGISIMKK